MKFFDYWKALNARFDEGDLPAMTQLVGYKLLAIFNERMFPSSLAISDRELMERTGIPSGHTIVDARRRLKNAGLIECDTRQGKTTRYRLTMQHRGSSEGAVWIIVVNKVDKKLERGEKFRFKIIRGKKIDSRMRTIRIVKSVNILKQGNL